MDRIKKAFSSSYDDVEQTEEDDAGLLSGVNSSITLSFQNRIKLFVGCFVLGVIFSILGSAFLWLPNGIILFALFYTFGNILSISSTCFLMGPFKQFKKMMDKKRWVWTLIAVGFMIMSIMAAVWWKKKILCVIFCLFQFVALTWYSLSYIPYAHDIIIRTVTACAN